MSIEAMKQALEALEEIHPGNMTPMAEEVWHKASAILSTAIEAAEKQEPVAWVERWYGSGQDQGWWIWERHSLTHGQAVARVGTGPFAERLTSIIVEKHNAALFPTEPAKEPFAPDPHGGNDTTPPAAPVQEPPDDGFTQALIERDEYHAIADELADMIAKITGEDIGEHTSANFPWRNALDAAENWLCHPPAAPVQEPIYQMQMMDGKWIDQAKQSYEYNKAHGHTVRIVYTTPPAAQPAPVQEPVGWLYPEGLDALQRGKCWTAYGTKQDDNCNIPVYLNAAVAPKVEPAKAECGGFDSHPAAPLQEPVAYSVGRTLHWHEGRGVSDAQLYTTPPAPAAPVQEPVAVVSGYYGGQCVVLPTNPARLFNSGTAFYTTPPAAQRQWVGLTDESVVSAAARVLSDRVAASCNVDCGDQWMLYGNDFLEDARAALEAAEAKLREKNGGQA